MKESLDAAAHGENVTPPPSWIARAFQMDELPVVAWIRAMSGVLTGT